MPRVTDVLLGRLEELHQQIIHDPYSSSYVDLNRSFHLEFYEAGTSTRTLGLIRGLEDAAQMYIGAWIRRIPYLRERAIRDHGELLEALRARDVDRAIEVTIRHLSLSLGVLDLMDGRVWGEVRQPAETLDAEPWSTQHADESDDVDD